TEEIMGLRDYLVEAHSPHAHRELVPFDVVPEVKSALAEYRPHLRSRQIAVTSTLPRQAGVRGIPEDAGLAIRTVLAAAAEHARSASTIRLHIGNREDAVELSLSLPDLKAPHVSPQELFAFGRADGKREAR